MTEQQRNLIRALWFLAGEIRAGHQISNAKLLEWEQQAQAELANTRPLRPDEQNQARADRWEQTYASFQTMVRRSSD
jgi:hypothetical protein